MTRPSGVSMRVDVTVSCRCGTVHRNVPKALWGKKTRCQVCGRPIHVPAPEAREETLDEIFEDFARSLAEPAGSASRRARIERYRLGRLAIRMGLATREEVELAMKVQTQARDLGFAKPIGAVLVEQGTLAETALRGLLDVQRKKIACIKIRDAGPPPALGLLDARVARVVVESALAGQDAIDECAHVLALTREMGFDWTLAHLLAERGAVAREVALRVQRDQEALLQRGLARVAPQRHATAQWRSPNGRTARYAGRSGS